MKKQFILLLAILCSSVFSTGQNILVCDNTPTAPEGTHVYNNLQTAIDSADVGDIIHVIPSTTDYGNIIINKELSIYGIGYTPDTETGYTSKITSINIRGSQANNITLSGLVITNVTSGISLGGFQSGDIILYEFSNLTIEYCSVARIYQNISYGILNNCVLKNNIISGSTNSNVIPIEFSTTLGRNSDIVISNNIICSNGSTSNSGIIQAGNFAVITNNLFTSDGDESRRAFSNLTDCIVSNNIFHGVSTEVDPGKVMFNNTFANNISFLGFSNTLPPIGVGGTNGGFGNLENTDPMLTDVGLNVIWDFDNNGALLPGSPALNAGSDGFDIGLSGGTYPFKFNNNGTTLPYIHLLENAGLIIEGQDLNVIIEARTNQ